MHMLSKLTIVGNLVEDPELTFSPSGVARATFRIASTPRVFDRASGEWKDGTTAFMRCVAFRQLAENIVETFSRGNAALVVGELKQRNWETEAGEKRSGNELSVDFIGPDLTWQTAQISKARRGGNATQAPAQSAQAAPPQVPAPGSQPAPAPAPQPAGAGAPGGFQNPPF